MKKKSFIVLLIIACMVCSIVLSSCSLVTVNTERQANRIMATVSVDLTKEFGDEVKVLGNDWDYDVTLEITRRDLISTVNYVINYYTQLYSQYGSSYNYDIEALLESSLDSMITQKYQTIAAMGELLLKANETGRINALYCTTAEYQAIYGKTLVPEGVLTIAERYQAISNVNEELQTQLDTYVEENTDDVLDKEKSEANNELSAYYLDGYFVEEVAIAKKVVTDEETTFADGLYASEVVDDGNEETIDLKVENVYAKISLKKGEDVKYVYMPIEENDLTLSEKEDADFVGKYVTVKTATVTVAGRQEAKVTEENSSGYETVSFTSEKVEYNLIAPRSAYVAEEEDEEDALVDVRYISSDKWADESAYTEAMTELKASIFNANPETYENNIEKDAYRQLRNSLESNGIGFITEDPGKDSANYNNYKYYNGLKYYYDSEFQMIIDQALEYEITVDASVSDSDVNNEYAVLVRKDKANYDKLSYKDQVKKFFETIKSDLSSVYYVPVEALCNTSYEIEPTDKAYEGLFTFDANEQVTGHSALVMEDNGKYTMKYAYLNVDGTYTINMFYVAHILISFDNVEGLDTAVKNVTADFTDKEKLMFIESMTTYIKTNPQLQSYIDEYDEEKDYVGSDVFGAEESLDEAMAVINGALVTAYNVGDYQTYLDAFKIMMTVYNDDSGSLKGSGYLVSVGDMENGWYQDFTDTGIALYFNLLNNYNVVLGSGNDGIVKEDLTANAYTDYGVHVMYVCFAPLFNVNIDVYGGIGIETELDIEGKTWKESIKDDLLELRKTNIYNEWKESIEEETVEKYSVKNEKNYKSLLEEIKE